MITMPKYPLVSVLIPSYNHENYVTEAIVSVLNQTYPNIELLVCDDASSDKSLEIIKKMPSHKLNIYNNDHNMGSAYTCNRLLSLASGEYVVYLASDDIIHPEKVEKQLRVMISKDADVLLAPVELLLPNGSRKKLDGDSVCRVIESGEYLELCYRGNRPGFLVQSGMFRKKALQDIGGFLIKYKSDDWLLMIRLLQAGAKLVCLNEHLALYRIHENNTHKNADYCLNEIELPVIRDFIPKTYHNSILSRVYRNASYKLVLDDIKKSFYYQLVGQRHEPSWDFFRYLAYIVYKKIIKFTQN